ncbi:MAG: metallophosphoesterase [Acidiferrobacter sp.]
MNLVLSDAELATVLQTTRVKGRVTQARRAAAMGVSVRQYRRYEQGLTPTPADRIASLYDHACQHVIERLPANPRGRDFIVGDLHGHGPALRRFLAEHGFCPETDRVFSVGDLIDRGPESLETLRLLYEPWFTAVRGNHEDMLLDYSTTPYQYGPPDSHHPFIANGGGWVLQLGPDARDELRYRLLPRVALLPHLLVIGTGFQRYHVTHAELDGPQGRITDAVLDAIGDTASGDLLPVEYIEGYGGRDRWRMRLLWGRSLMRGRSPIAFTDDVTVSTLPGLSPTFVGHTIVPQVLLQSSHIFLDTGAARMEHTGLGHMTIAEIPHADLKGIVMASVRAETNSLLRGN